MVEKTISEKPFWSLSIKDTLSLLEATEEGLSSEEAKKRLSVFGLNKIEQKKRVSRLRLFLRQFKNPLIIVLVVGAVITIALGKASDAIFISIAVFVNAALGYYQENKAEEALEDLKKYVTQFVRVYRDGGEKNIKAENLVPGDVIYVGQGDQVAADARLIYDNDLQIDEAFLTGESLPVVKTTKTVPEQSGAPDQTSMIFSGSTVLQGFGRAVVTATDEHTELGKIAKIVLRPDEQQTPLQKGLNAFSLKASFFLLILTLGVFFVAKNSGITTLDAFLISVAILVSAVPEGLPIVMTVILAIGVQRLAKQNGVIRKLSAGETLGSTSVILTDKTGTLTQAKMSLEQVTPHDGNKHEREDIPREIHALEMALLNLSAGIENPDEEPGSWRIIGKPIEVALIKGAANRGVSFVDNLKNKRQVNLLPFNSKNKFSASIYEVPISFLRKTTSTKNVYIQSILGAPEIILEKSSVPATKKEELKKLISTMAGRGDRLVAVAFKELSTLDDIQDWESEAIKDLQFLGILSLRDPLRPNVAKTIAYIQNAGVRVVIVTGDHAGTALSVANSIGLESTHKNILDGTKLEAMTKKELLSALHDIHIVSRVSPLGKQKIVDAFQSKGEVVAMNGDGVNDAPALKKANIGVAMGSGTDVTKGVADLVLLDDDFETLVQAIKEGRRIIANIRKAIVYLSSAIINEIFLVGGSLLLGLPIPINALQILWVNFFTDSFPGIALAFEEHIDQAGKTPTQLQQGIFNKEMKVLISISAIVSTLLLFATYLWLLPRFEEATVKTFIFAAFATYSLFLGFSMRSLRRSILTYNPFGNLYLVGSVILGSGFTLAAIYIPQLQSLFNTVALSWPWLIAILIFGLVNIIIIEIAKHFLAGKE